MGNSKSSTSLKDHTQTLVSKEIESTEESYWHTLLTTSTTFNQVFEELPSAQVNTLVSEYPQNAKTLILKSLSCLEQTWRQVHTYDQSQLLSCINSVRFLARLVPFTLKEDFLEFWWNEQTLAIRLLKATTGLMFTPAYSLIASVEPSSLDEFNKVELARLWDKGLLSDQVIAEPNSQMLSNRYELLMLLIACMGQTLECEGSELLDNPNSWVWYLTSQAFPHSAQLFYSLMNVLISYDNSAYLKLPYSSYLNTPLKDKVTEASLHVLMLLFEFEHPPQDKEFHRPDHLLVSELVQSYSDSKNEMLLRLVSINDPSQLKLISSAFVRLFQNLAYSYSSYLPESQKKLPFENELSILLWKLIQTNPSFEAHSISTGDLAKVIMPLLLILHQSVNSVTHQGLVMVINSVFMKLSSNRNFGVLLNQPVNYSIPFPVPLFQGNHSDLLIVTFSKLIENGNKTAEPFYQTWLLILANISPFVRKVSSVSANKILELLSIFSTKNWLLAAKQNHFLVFYLFEFINYQLQYHWEGASYLVLEILKSKRVIYKLWRMEVENPEESGVEEHPTQGEIKVNLEEIEERKEEEEESQRGENLETVQNTETEPEWTATPEWFYTWKNQLPIKLVFIVITELQGKVENLIEQKKKIKDSELVKYVEDYSMVGILPEPHRILLRKEQLSWQIILWFKSYIWITVFLKTQSLGFFDEGRIKLFRIGVPSN